MSKSNFISLLTGGVSFLPFIDSVLSYIILILSILNLLINLVKTIIDKFKKKNYDISEDLKETTEQLEELQQKYKGGD